MKISFRIAYRRIAENFLLSFFPLLGTLNATNANGLRGTGAFLWSAVLAAATTTFHMLRWGWHKTRKGLEISVDTNTPSDQNND
jgi:hypothetical protein